MRKVVIVPYDQYLFLTSQQLSNHPINNNNNILNSQPEENNSVLVQSQDKNDFLANDNTFQGDNDNCAVSMEKDLILTPFSKNQIRNAESILKYISKNMSWNELGELIIGGQVINGSHVTDLIKDCLSIRERKWDPIGHEYFYGNLYDIPLSLVFNIKRRPLLGSGKTPNQTRVLSAKNPLNHSNEPIYPKKRKLNSSVDNDWIEQWHAI